MSPRRGLLFRRQLGFREDAAADSQHKTAPHAPSARRLLKRFAPNFIPRAVSLFIDNVMNYRRVSWGVLQLGSRPPNLVDSKPLLD